MPTIKIKLQGEELNALIRRATELGTTAEALAFGALSYAMRRIRGILIQRESFKRSRI
jgi:hypothetical protein